MIFYDQLWWIINSIKEYHGIVDRNNGPTTNETWRITKTEEEFETDDVRAIYDFQTVLFRCSPVAFNTQFTQTISVFLFTFNATKL